MPMSCVAFKCTSRHKKDSGITFHSFPFRNSLLLSTWTRAVRRDEWKPDKSSRLCSLHFKEKWFTLNNDRKRLLNQAIPTIFEFPEHLNRGLKDSGVPSILDNPDFENKNHQSILSPEMKRQKIVIRNTVRLITNDSSNSVSPPSSSDEQGFIASSKDHSAAVIKMLPTRGRPRKQETTVARRSIYCCYGTCNSSSSRLELGVKFLAFPQPCMAYRNAQREGHISKNCKECSKCLRWIHLCKRSDGKFNSLDDVNPRQTFICSKHFVDLNGPTGMHPDPFPADQQVQLTPLVTTRPPPQPVVKIEKTARDEPICDDNDVRINEELRGNVESVDWSAKEDRVKQEGMIKLEPVDHSYHSIENRVNNGQNIKEEHIDYGAENSVEDNVNINQQQLLAEISVKIEC